MATSMASQRQIKGILKNKTPASSLVVASAEQAQLTFKKLNKKTQKWNEVNFLSTYHPADKDYRLMKTGIPNTLYHNSMAYAEDADSDSECHEMLSPDFLDKKLGVGPNDLDLEEESSGDEENHLSPQELEKKRQFEMKRKLHSNEGLNIKFARLLISKDLHDDDDEDEGMSETAD
ncbi:protein phosphatase inhibitor 2-like isoform X1 [Mus pahari]|uniref:protein phosphatase inhibitor 2-like isoform X1 n=1 Tax=Mus pahari TaxID=10093 RepID=UPI000A313D97|nr:protein phosphatase inhibitor 2-like isoform X1 [Mus pahari]